MKRIQKILLLSALPLALFFFSERLFWFNYRLALYVWSVGQTYDNSNNVIEDQH